MAEVAATIVREGWLQKRSQHIGDWRDRYFILFDNGDLLGFRTQPDRGHYRNPLNEFTVRDCQIMAMDRPRPYSFTIRGTQVSTNAAIERNFSVHTEREREEWIAAIRYVSRLLTESGDHPGTSKRMETDNDGDMEVDPVNDSRRATLENYEIIKVLGRGAYGKVVLSREKTTGRLYATKIVKKQYISQMGEVHHAHSENRVLKKAKHPFLTALRYSFQTDDCICFVMEYANGGELFFHLRRERCFSEERTRFYGAEIVSALGYLHSEGIIYRDLKLENLLLDKDGHIKIADFGLCKLNIMYGNTTRTFCGTPEYQAPEVIKKHEYGPAVDWWGTGVVMYEMMCGRLPFYNRDRDQLSTLIVKHEVRFPPILSAPCRSLLAGLLTKEPELRLGAGPDDALEIMRHPFFASINWAHLVAKKIPPPFKPQVSSDMDTKYFDPEFTGQSVALTPPERGIVMEEGFSQFSYQDIISSEQSMRSRSLD